jgi:DNA-binding NarL/FixJ family response regulator
MRAAGVRRIPRGRRASTRRNPFGLTRRELETLEAIAKGLSNSRIGVELSISAKTVDHHVSAVLAKLGAPSRQEAARIAREQRLIAQYGEGAAAK